MATLLPEVPPALEFLFRSFSLLAFHFFSLGNLLVVLLCFCRGALASFFSFSFIRFFCEEALANGCGKANNAASLDHLDIPP
jgi:hypothetical protein